ncbi:MAG: DUF2142 domain-containing protein, partial [Bacteroidia bacterium]|nr:DUF2142 domain-containing protein [Bacteroidia bacterium]
KWVFVLLNLLPMPLYIANSFSADTVTNAMAFVWLALILKQMFAGTKPNKKTLLLLVLLACGLGLAKMLYVFLVLLVLLIPSTNFKNRGQWLLFVAVISLPAIMVAYWWSSVVMQNYLSFAAYNPEGRMHATLVEGADYYLQKDYLLKHPLQFGSVLFYSLTHHPGFYLSSYVGYFGTFMDTPLPVWTCVLAYFGMILITLTDRNGPPIIASQKWVLVLTACVVFIFLIFSQYLTWIRVGGSGVEELQGRYLITIMPLLLLLLNRSSVQHRWNLPVLVLPIVLTLNVVSIKSLYNRYVNEDSLIKTVLFYDFDRQQDSLPLQMKDKITNETALSGKQSLRLLNDSQSVILYKSDKIKQGDWIWLEGMCKGSGGRLYISGKKNNSEVFNYNVEYPRFVNSKGWGKLKFAQVIQNNMDSVEVTFKLLNVGNTAVYFDDVRIEHKTY